MKLYIKKIKILFVILLCFVIGISTSLTIFAAKEDVEVLITESLSDDKDSVVIKMQILVDERIHKITKVVLPNNEEVLNSEHIEYKVAKNEQYNFVIHYTEAQEVIDNTNNQKNDLTMLQTMEEKTKEVSYSVKSISDRSDSNTVINETSGQAYPNLVDAMNGLTGDATLKIVGDSTIDAAITLNKGYAVTIVSDGNYTLKRNENLKARMFTVSNGSLTIGDGTKTNNVTIDGNKAEQASAESVVYVASTATFTLNDGASIVNNSATHGGAIFNVGECIINGGKIQGNESRSSGYGGGVYNGVKTTFTMNGGEISDNSANIGGGIIAMCDGSGITSVFITGGTITNNIARQAGSGAAFSGDGVKAIMSGGIISKNKKNQQGTGVWNVDKSEFTMTGGVITQNEYSGWGGGIYNRSATFLMSGGEISENLGMYGGGINSTSSLVSISGGTIKNNLAREQRTGDSPSNGSAINLNGANSILQLSKDANIAISDSIYLSNLAAIKVTGALNKGQFVVYHQKIKKEYGDTDFTIASGKDYTLTSKDKDRFFVIGSDTPSRISEVQYHSKLDTTKNEIVSQKDGLTLTKNATSVTYSSLNDAIESVAQGEEANITLTDNVLLNKKIEVNGKINIIGNSNQIILRDSHNNGYLDSDKEYLDNMFVVNEGGSLSFGKNIIVDGQLEDKKTSSSILNKETLSLIDGASLINSNAQEASAILNQGTCILEEAIITGNKDIDKGAIVNEGNILMSGKIKSMDSIYLLTGHPVKITGSLDDQAIVNIYSKDEIEGTIVASGEGYSLTDTDLMKVNLLNVNVRLVKKDNDFIISAKSLDPSSEKQIKSFKLNGQQGVIDQLTSTITLSLPYGTDVSNLIATFTSSDKAIVKVNNINQISGTSVNDFTNAVVYTVVAEDGSESSYTVIVTVDKKPDSDPKPDQKPDVKPDSKPDQKPDVKPDSKPDVKPAPTPDIKPDFTPDIKPDGSSNESKPGDSEKSGTQQVVNTGDSTSIILYTVFDISVLGILLLLLVKKVK